MSWNITKPISAALSKENKGYIPCTSFLISNEVPGVLLG